MAVRAIVVVACFGATFGMTLVNRKSQKCLDLFCPCLDGSEDKDCTRVKPEDLTKGTNLQLYKCNGRRNQEFEFLSNGRIRNPLTGLCIDIASPCKDHFRTPCERVPVEDLGSKANIQLFTCHEDTGFLSNSYGNQKWNFEESLLSNRLSGLCLEPKVDPVSGEIVDTTNIQAETCQEAELQKFDWASAVDPEEGPEMQMQQPQAMSRTISAAAVPSQAKRSGDNVDDPVKQWAKNTRIVAAMLMAATAVFGLALVAVRQARRTSTSGSLLIAEAEYSSSGEVE